MKYLLKMRVFAMLLAIVMVVGCLPAPAFAVEAGQEESTAPAEAVDASGDTGEAEPAEEGSGGSIYEHGYYRVVSESDYNLAPGAVETQMVLNNAEGTDRKVVHFIEVDPNETTIQVLPGYYGIDKLDPNDLSDSTYWRTAKMTDMVAYYENVLGYNVVGAMNTSLAYDSNAPYDIMVYNGTVLADPANHTGTAQTYLAVIKNDNGTVTFELRSSADGLKGNEWQAVSANFGWLVKDGVLTTTTVERDSSDASRSMLGVKADGTLVICQVDGRNAPVSTGLSNYEMGELMLALGCVWAVNGDGGGSSSFITKREGTASNVMRSVPSDGSERETINGIMVVSTAQATGEFDHSVLTTEHDYYAAGARATVQASGVDASGSPAEIPTDVTWALSNDSMGTIELGTFTSNGTLGDVTIQMLYDGKVVGEKTIHVVNPDTFGFDSDSTVIPYGKSVELVVEGTYGTDSWSVGLEGAYTLTLSDTTAAVLEGNTLAASSDESKTGVEVTAVYQADPTVTDVLAVTFGKGSEILFDFENGDVSGWMSFDEAKQWSIDNGVNNTLVGSDPMAGQYSLEVDGNTALASAANGGQVKNGQYSLAWTLDNTTASFAGWTYNILYYLGGSTVLRDVENGKNATSLGMWLYIPEGATGLAFQSQLYVKNADNTYSCKQAHFTFTTVDGTVKNLNSCTEADIPESRWVYASIDLSDYDYIALPDPYDESNSRSPSIVRTYVKPMKPAALTFYIDDITLDYSSAVEDRVLPTIQDASYATADTAVSLEDGLTVSSNSLSFSARVADNAGLNPETGKIFVDGVALTNVSVSGGMLYTTGNVTLTNGAHTICFAIQDKLGNEAKKSYSITVGTGAVLTLSGHNDLNNTPEYDSVYYVDIVASDIAAINSITTTLKLQTANTWELDHMTAAEGFKASYVYNELSRLATVTVTKTGNTALTGEQILVSIPVRVWSWNGINHITGKAITPEEQFASGYCPIVTIDCEVESGSVTFADGTYDGYVGAFGGAVSVATKLNDNVNAWHYHTAEAVADLAATCTTDGYTGRTYCNGCGSVVNWGTTIPAYGHNWLTVDGIMQCEKCHEAFNGELDGITYINGVVAEGWVNGTYYYVGGVKVTGQLVIDGVMCTFDENGVYQPDYQYNGFYLAEGGWTYYMDNMMATGWVYIDSNWYYFQANGYAATGSLNIDGKVFDFEGEQGKTLGAWVKTDAGTRLYIYTRNYYKNTFAEREGVTYYFNGSGYRLENGTYAISAAGEWIGAYAFAENGALIGPVNGVFQDVVSGDYYYAVDGKLQFGSGLIQWNGGIYYVRSNGRLATTAWYVPANALNGLAPAAGTYQFGADGKMILDNGPKEVDGVLYYYIDGVQQFGLGLVKWEGDIYYVRSNGRLATTAWYVGANALNGLAPAAGTYQFGADGKMILDTGPKEVDGVLYYYIDGVQQFGLGLVKWEGNIYYVRSNGRLATTAWYVPANALNGLMPAAGTYQFGTDGKMILDNGPKEVDGVLYYYIDGIQQFGLGLVEWEGDIYYVRSNGRLATTEWYVPAEATNGLVESAGVYTFGADGKMVR